MFEVISMEFYENIKNLIKESRKHVVTYVNTTMLFTYKFRMVMVTGELQI